VHIRSTVAVLISVSGEPKFIAGVCTDDDS
jgi:hypothetical protein